VRGFVFTESVLQRSPLDSVATIALIHENSSDIEARDDFDTSVLICNGI